MSLLKRSDHTLTQGAKYIVVGVAAFLADFSCVWALTELGHIYYLVSASIAFVVGLSVNYILSVTWVFASRRFEDRTKEFFLFSLIGLFTVVVGLVLMWVFTEIAQIHYLASKIMVTAVVFPLNFGIRKSLLFTARQSIA
jgi:putative flippase GtrA